MAARNKNKRRFRQKLTQLDKAKTKAIDTVKASFRARFGRDPGPNDPLYFDPDEIAPTALTTDKFNKIMKEFLENAEQNGVKPQLIYAARKCGFILDKSNYKDVTDEMFDEWCNACDEWELMIKEGSHRIVDGTETNE